MRILIVSDSHGNLDSLKTAVRKEAPDHILHLGDYTRDAAALAKAYPQIPLDTVCGNCDTFDRKNPAPAEKIITLGGCRIFLCHGHTFSVKSSYSQLLAYARQQNVELCLFGHTHVPYLGREVPGFWLLNPGSIGASLRREYAIAEISEGQLRCVLKTL